jgi:hypothetical protein
MSLDRVREVALAGIDAMLHVRRYKKCRGHIAQEAIYGI